MAFLLVRHAKAGRRAEWDQPDDLRPLSPTGERQAQGLVGALAATATKRILTSPARRCIQTVEPLAEHLGLPVEEHPALAESADFEQTWALMLDLAAADALGCTHGNLIDLALDRLRRRGVEAEGGAWVAKKGSVWVLEADARPRFVRARPLPPPPSGAY